MLTGRVTPQWDAVVEVRLEAVDGRAQAIQAAVDTGFTGFLSLPPALIAGLGLPMVGFKTVALADGSQTTLFVFNALIEWEGQRLVVPPYEAGGSPLIGMRLLRGSRLTVDVVEDGRVEIGLLVYFYQTVSTAVLSFSSSFSPGRTDRKPVRVAGEYTSQGLSFILLAIQEPH